MVNVGGVLDPIEEVVMAKPSGVQDGEGDWTIYCSNYFIVLSSSTRGRTSLSMGAILHGIKSNCLYWRGSEINAYCFLRFLPVLRQLVSAYNKKRKAYLMKRITMLLKLLAMIFPLLLFDRRAFLSSNEAFDYPQNVIICSTQGCNVIQAANINEVRSIRLGTNDVVAWRQWRYEARGKEAKIR
ncbi:hypothetical protein CPB86DRAFT_800284 [Serendipita vermifera]|nr:hypothetical protein CPB86DRAFT_800284 [Serendipita vermifera]